MAVVVVATQEQVVVAQPQVAEEATNGTSSSSTTTNGTSCSSTSSTSATSITSTTSSSPSATSTSSSPGATNTSSSPGATNTSSSPGATNTSSSPGAAILAFPELRPKASIFHGQREFRARTAQLFHDMGLPENMLPLDGIVESGFVAETGFSWTLVGAAQRHHFAKAGRTCAYETLITSTISKGRMSDIRGVKAKELGLWVPIHEIYVDDSKPHNKRLVFKGIMGLSRSMSFHLFE